MLKISSKLLNPEVWAGRQLPNMASSMGRSVYVGNGLKMGVKHRVSEDWVYPQQKRGFVGNC